MSTEANLPARLSLPTEFDLDCRDLGFSGLLKNKSMPAYCMFRVGAIHVAYKW